MSRGRGLKPLAERFYDYFDRLLELGVYRARPTLAEVSAHRDLAGMTGEDIRRVWPEVLEIELSREDHKEYVELFKLLENDEVQRLLNGECEQRTSLRPANRRDHPLRRQSSLRLRLPTGEQIHSNERGRPQSRLRAAC